MSDSWPQLRKKWGRYLPWQRINVDQVPCPFVNNMDSTYEVKGAKRVAINQGGPSLSKRQCTLQVCFRPVVPPKPEDTAAWSKYKQHLMEQPPPCILFNGTGIRISDDELSQYPKGLVVLWQKKAWVDRPVALDWVKQVLKPFVQAERAAGVMSDSDRYLLFEDNLDAQKQPEYISALNAIAIDDHKVPPNETDQMQPVDRGFGQQVSLLPLSMNATP